MANEDAPILRLSNLDFEDFPKFADEAFEKYSYNFGAVKAIPPNTLLSSNHLVSCDSLKPAKPMLQTYEKKAPGVYHCVNLNEPEEDTILHFAACNAEESLRKTGICSYDDSTTFWGTMMDLYEDVGKTKQFPRYLADVEGTLFVDPDHSWQVHFNFYWCGILHVEVFFDQNVFKWYVPQFSSYVIAVCLFIVAGVYPGFRPLSSPS